MTGKRGQATLSNLEEEFQVSSSRFQVQAKLEAMNLKLETSF